MSYQFLGKEVIEKVEYALLLDDESGNVIRRPIITEAVGAPRIIDKPSFAPAQMHIVEGNATLPPTVHGYVDAEHKIEDMPRTQSIIPPHLRGVFAERDTPNEAIERRTA